VFTYPGGPNNKEDSVFTLASKTYFVNTPFPYVDPLIFQQTREASCRFADVYVAAIKTYMMRLRRLLVFIVTDIFGDDIP
jgi:hypothetical protein